MGTRTYAVVQRWETEELDFEDWAYRKDDFISIFEKMLELTNNFAISDAAAKWSRDAAVDDSFEFDEGIIEIICFDNWFK